MSMFLIQRLRLRDPIDPDRGFDGFFEMEYMGSSEFEWGAPATALRAMRGQGHVMAGTERCTYDGVENDVYFVGRWDTFPVAVNAWHAWFQNPKRRNQENPRFHAEFARTHAPTDDRHRTVAWWSFDDALAWALDPAVADRLITAFNTPAKKGT